MGSPHQVVVSVRVSSTPAPSLVSESYQSKAGPSRMRVRGFKPHPFRMDTFSQLVPG